VLNQLLNVEENGTINNISLQTQFKMAVPYAMNESYSTIVQAVSGGNVSVEQGSVLSNILDAFHSSNSDQSKAVQYVIDAFSGTNSKK